MNKQSQKKNFQTQQPNPTNNASNSNNRSEKNVQGPVVPTQKWEAAGTNPNMKTPMSPNNPAQTNRAKEEERKRGGIETSASPGVDINGGRSPQIEEMKVLNQTVSDQTGNDSFSGDQAPNEEAVRQRAYELYQKRGGKSGSELEDWLEAQKSLRSEPFNQTASQNG